MIEGAGRTPRPLPRSSPDLDPIEQDLAELKQANRRAEARSFDALVVAKPAIEAVTPADARASFAAAGYPLAGPFEWTPLQVGRPVASPMSTAPTGTLCSLCGPTG